MSELDLPGPDLNRLDELQKLERLAETMRDRPAGDWFRNDLEEARAMAEHDARFQSLAAGLAAETLGGRLDAINGFFDQIGAIELAGLTLPPKVAGREHIYTYFPVQVPDRPAALFVPESAGVAAAVARKIRHYSQYGYLRFEGTRNVDKGTWEAGESPLTVSLAAGGDG